jgi:phage baseplate assembly protein W
VKSNNLQRGVYQPQSKNMVEDNNQRIEESIENVLETTNGAKEMMSDTCTS